MPFSASFLFSRRVALILWILSLGILLAGLGRPVTQRTQEARVLETAREMLESRDARQWMVPLLNGKLRLEKPPLAYWMAAGGFKLFGVNEFGGRLPFALCGWLLLALVYRFGHRLENRRFGFFSALMLLGTWMFFRNFRLAETDGPAALFLTGAIYWLWRGMRAIRSAPSFLFFLSAGACMGLAALAKGPQAAFAILFFIFWVISERNWMAIARLLLSGALLAALVIGGSWYYYIHAASDGGVLWEELQTAMRGGDHQGHAINYLPWILRATLPWTGFVFLGLLTGLVCLAAAIPRFPWRRRWLRRIGRRWRRDSSLRLLTIWSLAILIPLLLAGNKQNHYLAPMMPALATLGAYVLCRGLEADAPDAAPARAIFGITYAISLVTPAAVFFIARYHRRPIGTAELATLAMLAIALLATGWAARRRGFAPAAAAYGAGAACALSLLMGWWLPSLELGHHRAIARQLTATFDQRPFVFYGKDFSLPLIWNMRQTIPVIETPQALDRRLDEAPRTVVLTESKNNHQPPAIPERLRETATYEIGGEGAMIRVYVRKRGRGHLP